MICDDAFDDESNNPKCELIQTMPVRLKPEKELVIV